jgi:site-specific recombinase XerD
MAVHRRGRAAIGLRGVVEGLAGGETGRRTHDLRHFTASALIAGGASVKLVQTVLGHSSAVVRCRRTHTCGQVTTTARGP